MQIDVQYKPSYALAIVTLAKKERIQTEAGAMVGMSPDMEMSTAAKGGFRHSLGRMVGGESFFLNTYTGKHDGDIIALAPPLPGDIMVLELNGDTIMVQSGSYLASSEGITIDTKWSGAKTFFGREGLVMLRVSGHGQVIVASYGAIHPMSLEKGEHYIIDTGHIVTFEDQMPFNIKKVGSWKSTFLSGEGLVIDLEGPGNFTLQSRSQVSFLDWVIPRVSR
jgi:uncharacterized protein (TIGR00266 family)